MDEILIATSNKGKLAEIKHFLGEDCKLLDLSSYKTNQPEENGESFHDNALIKASDYSEVTKMTVLADDSGLAVEALNGAPGVFTARLGRDKDRFDKLLQLIKDSGSSNYRAHFVCVLCYKKLGDKPVFFEGKSYGSLVFPPRGEYGFGFDPIFIPDKANKTFAEMTQEEKLTYSARGEALEKFKLYMKRNIKL